MRIAWIVYGPLRQRTGGYLYDALVIERLREAGDVVSVIELGSTPSARHAARIVARVAEARPDAIVGDELCFRELTVLFARVRAVPKWMLVHHLGAWELPAPSRLTRLVERAALRLADATIATSEPTAARLVRERWVRAAHVVPPGADRLPRRAHRSFDAARMELLFVGALSPRKRVLELLDAFERCAPPHARLTLAGSTERDRAYARTVRSRVAASAHSSAATRVLGEVDDDVLADLLAGADALVLPSSLEGYGMVISEALHAGTPVIAADTGAASSLVRHGVDGWIFSADRIEDALRAYVSLPPRARGASLEAASSRRAALPTWSGAGDALGALLRGFSRRAPRPTL